ncbi:Methyltransferase domain-containing protein [Lentzea fradiae]|uniref:Methyltransferase domain-containing protein n=1 Tax=Lentzea fradiae TaxID=200378 RepID=A0A1G7L1T0_9PSEU|nr:class I SAM-dependent methyltransferase [Lentzea fradiae]SDF43321.1 Methyltransferase domain-containing protein [Lentzea fradiae]
MQAQPLPAEHADLYAGYDEGALRLAEWALGKTGESAPATIVDFFESVWRNQAAPVRRVLELCCGSGRNLRLLRERGYSVTGVDGSPSMLAHARAALGDEVELVQGELPELPVRQRADAVVCPGSALNHLAGQDLLGRAFAAVARVLPRGRTFTFDLMSWHMLKEAFSDNDLAVDLGDLAAIWWFDSEPGTDYCDYHFSQFTQTGALGLHRVDRTTHRLHAFKREVVRRAALDAGFRQADVYDNYTTRPAADDTLYETWVLVR